MWAIYILIGLFDFLVEGLRECSTIITFDVGMSDVVVVGLSLIAISHSMFSLTALVIVISVINLIFINTIYVQLMNRMRLFKTFSR